MELQAAAFHESPHLVFCAWYSMGKLLGSNIHGNDKQMSLISYLLEQSSAGSTFPVCFSNITVVLSMLLLSENSVQILWL